MNGAVSGIFAATGQTCIAGHACSLQESIHNAFVDRLLALAHTTRMGDPMRMETQVGPITTRPQYEKVLSYIEVAKQEGAQAAHGRRPCDPTGMRHRLVRRADHIRARAQHDAHRAGRSIRAGAFHHQIHRRGRGCRHCNDVRFGLGSGVWTSDIGRAIRMAERIQACTVWVNIYRAVSYMSPFGGYKNSGLGRENGIDAIREYLQVKSVWINTGAVTANPFVMR